MSNVILMVFFMIIIMFSSILPVLEIYSGSINTYYVYMDKNGLKRFLESQYIPEIGLLRAATTAYPENVTIYIANDNVLASRALAVLGSPLADKILIKLNNEYNGGSMVKSIYYWAETYETNSMVHLMNS